MGRGPGVMPCGSRTVVRNVKPPALAQVPTLNHGKSLVMLGGRGGNQLFDQSLAIDVGGAWGTNALLHPPEMVVVNQLIQQVGAR